MVLWMGEPVALGPREAEQVAQITDPESPMRKWLDNRTRQRPWLAIAAVLLLLLTVVLSLVAVFQADARSQAQDERDAALEQVAQLQSQVSALQAQVGSLGEQQLCRAAFGNELTRLQGLRDDAIALALSTLAQPDVGLQLRVGEYLRVLAAPIADARAQQGASPSVCADNPSVTPTIHEVPPLPLPTP